MRTLSIDQLEMMDAIATNWNIESAERYKAFCLSDRWFRDPGYPTNRQGNRGILTRDPKPCGACGVLMYPRVGENTQNYNKRTGCCKAHSRIANQKLKWGN